GDGDAALGREGEGHDRGQAGDEVALGVGERHAHADGAAVGGDAGVDEVDGDVLVELGSAGETDMPPGSGGDRGGARGGDLGDEVEGVVVAQLVERLLGADVGAEDGVAG